MRRDRGQPRDLPMPPDRLGALLARRAAAPRPDPLHPVPSREPATATGDLARILLAEAAQRRLASGELLLVSEEATLADLEAAAARVAPAVAAACAPPGAEPALAALAAPRLWCARVWSVFDWQPPLAEHLRLAAAALSGGMVLEQTMLVGHVETWPERIEHLMRLRDLVDDLGGRGGRPVRSLRLADPADLPRAAPRRSIAAAARPAVADHDRRHALAVARLALGPGIVRTAQP